MMLMQHIELNIKKLKYSNISSFYITKFVITVQWDLKIFFFFINSTVKVKRYVFSVNLKNEYRL